MRNNINVGKNIDLRRKKSIYALSGVYMCHSFIHSFFFFFSRTTETRRVSSW